MKLKLFLPYIIHITNRRIQTTEMQKRLKLTSLPPVVLSASKPRAGSLVKYLSCRAWPTKVVPTPKTDIVASLCNLAKAGYIHVRA